VGQGTGHVRGARPKAGSAGDLAVLPHLNYSDRGTPGPWKVAPLLPDRLEGDGEPFTTSSGIRRRAEGTFR
jgi:hypothetical protein